MGSVWCRLNELLPHDCNQALAGAVKQLQRGIDEPEYRDGVMRIKRMVCPHEIQLECVMRCTSHRLAVR